MMTISPKTAKECERVETVHGIKAVLNEYRLHSPIVARVFNLVGAIDDFTIEDVYVLIAFHALCSLEKVTEGYTKHLERCGTPALDLQEQPNETPNHKHK